MRIQFWWARAYRRCSLQEDIVSILVNRVPFVLFLHWAIGFNELKCVSCVSSAVAAAVECKCDMNPCVTLIMNSPDKILYAYTH